jgi:hypothetical protein
MTLEINDTVEYLDQLYTVVEFNDITATLANSSGNTIVVAKVFVKPVRSNG